MTSLTELKAQNEAFLKHSVMHARTFVELITQIESLQNDKMVLREALEYERTGCDCGDWCCDRCVRINEALEKVKP